MRPTLLADVPWILGIALQALIAVAMLRRGRLRDFPVFFVYTAFQVVRSGLQFYVRHWVGPSEYFWVYWSLQGVSVFLGLLAIQEVYRHVFRRYDAIRNLGAMLFRWSTAALLMIAVVAATSTTGSEASRLTAGILAFEVGVRVVQCGLLLLLFLLSGYFGLAWRQPVFGIALGLGLFASVQMLGATLRAHFGPGAGPISVFLNSGSYFCAILIWTGYFVLPEPVVRVQELPKYDLDAWNQALVQLLNR